MADCWPIAGSIKSDTTNSKPKNVCDENVCMRQLADESENSLRDPIFFFELEQRKIITKIYYSL
jgi:hypothetical protein